MVAVGLKSQGGADVEWLTRASVAAASEAAAAAAASCSSSSAAGASSGSSPSRPGSSGRPGGRLQPSGSESGTLPSAPVLRGVTLSKGLRFSLPELETLYMQVGWLWSLWAGWSWGRMQVAGFGVWSW